MNLESDLDNLVRSMPPDKRFISDSQPSNHLVYLLHWCHSLAMYLVCLALPCTSTAGRSYHMCTTQQIGSGLINDANFLFAIREVLVMLKMWSNVIPNLLRDYQMLPNQNSLANESGNDKLAQLFRLMTKMYQYAHDSKEFDESLVGECLSFAETNPKFSVPKPSTGNWLDPETLFGSNFKEVCSMFTQNLPLSFTFLRSPSYEIVKWRLRMDSVRQFYVDPFSNCRICSRCGNISMKRESSLEWPALPDSWEMKFEGSCCCGGLWRMNTRL